MYLKMLLLIENGSTVILEPVILHSSVYICRLNRDQHIVGSCQRIDCQHTQKGIQSRRM